MKVWMLFGSLTYFLIVVIFGYSLSNNIEGNIEYMIFWMLYIATILTISILASSFFMSLSLKDLKGIPGERGEIGDSGERGETGVCEINCRDKIGYNIIINAINGKTIICDVNPTKISLGCVNILEKSDIFKLNPKENIIKAIANGRKIFEIKPIINNNIRFYKIIKKI